MFSKFAVREFAAKAGATVSNKNQVQLKKKYLLLLRKSRSSHHRCSVKEGLQGPAQVFSVNIAKFLRTPILESIREQMFLKISTSVTNLPKGGNS